MEHTHTYAYTYTSSILDIRSDTYIYAHTYIYMQCALACGFASVTAQVQFTEYYDGAE